MIFKKHSIRKGVSFGLTSGIITTLGLIVGLNSGTHSRLVVLGGIFVIAVADAMSDAMGIHISEEAEAKHMQKTIWESTFATFFSKFIVALTFAVPFLLLELPLAIVISIVWGLLLISLFSYKIAKKEKLKPYKVVFEHLIITVLVVIITYYVGIWISTFV